MIEGDFLLLIKRTNGELDDFRFSVFEKQKLRAALPAVPARCV